MKADGIISTSINWFQEQLSIRVESSMLGIYSHSLIEANSWAVWTMRTIGTIKKRAYVSAWLAALDTNLMSDAG